MKFRARFNLYKSNMELFYEGRRGFYKEKLIELFFNHYHNGSHKDMMVQIIDFCDLNNQKKHENCMRKLRTFYPGGFNMKRINQ